MRLLHELQVPVEVEGLEALEVEQETENVSPFFFEFRGREKKFEVIGRVLAEKGEALVKGEVRVSYSQGVI